MMVILFLLLLRGIWTQGMTSEPQDIATTLKTSVPGMSSASLFPTFSEAKDVNPVTSSPMTTKVPEKGKGTKPEVSPPSSDLRTANEVSFPEASTAATSDLHVSEPTVFWEVSSQESSNLVINANSNPAEASRKSLALQVMTNETVASGPPVTMTTGSLGTSEVASRPPVTMTTGSLGTSGVASGPPVTMATASLETSAVDSGPPVTMATASLETSAVDSGPPITMATASPETSAVDSGPPVTMATASLETSAVDSGSPVTIATGSPPTPKGARGSPDSMVKTLAMTTSASSKDTSSPQLSAQGTKGTLLVATLVALMAVLVLVVLLLLWRQRQKRRTGALTLSVGGKRNGVVDAWAGPARVPEEEALMPPPGDSGGEKRPGVSAGEGAGPQPTLTTFFDRRKSQQCSLEMGEPKAGSAPLLKAEEEHPGGRKDEEASEGPELRKVEAPQCL